MTPSRRATIVTLVENDPSKIIGSCVTGTFGRCGGVVTDDLPNIERAGYEEGR